MRPGDRVRTTVDLDGLPARSEGVVADFQNPEVAETYVRFDGATPAVAVPLDALERA